MDSQKPKVCIFDFDGTLVNSMDHLMAIAGRTLEKTHGLTRSRAEHLYRLTSGLPFRQQVAKLFPDDPRNKAAVQQFEDEKKQGYSGHPFFDDAGETVRYLRDKGIRVVVSSSNQQEIIDGFVARGPITFDLVLGYRDRFTKGKCHFDYIQKTLGISTAGMLFVGDSLYDAGRALAENIKFVAKSGLTSRADFQTRYPTVPVIDRLSELKEML